MERLFRLSESIRMVSCHHTRKSGKCLRIQSTVCVRKATELSERAWCGKLKSVPGTVLKN